MAEREAQCSCGHLRLKAAVDPVRVRICHCRACQRRTGNVFGVQARFPLHSVEISGTSTAYVRTAESGNRLTFHFCPACGATVYYTLESEPNLVGVPVGAFADPDFPAPDMSIYEEARHPWVDMPDGMKRHR